MCDIKMCYQDVRISFKRNPSLDEKQSQYEKTNIIDTFTYFLWPETCQVLYFFAYVHFNQTLNGYLLIQALVIVIK